MIIDRICTKNQLCLEIRVVYCPFSLDSSLHGSDQLLQRAMNTSDRMWNKTFSESNVVPPWVLVLGTSNPHKILCSCLCSPFQSSRYMAQSSTVCFLILPRLDGSTKRLVNHVLAIRKLVKELTPGAVYPHTFRENRSQTKIGHDPAVTRNTCVRVVLSRGAVFQTWRQIFTATRSALLQRLTAPPR